MLATSWGIKFCDGLDYQMPDGVICDDMSSGTAKTTFYGCSNGRTYQNPAYWSEVRKDCK